MSVATKLRGLITGKQYVIDKLNAKAETSLEINAKWTDIGNTIENITTGIEPTGQAYINSNGIHNVSGYATALVEVEGGIAQPTLNTPSISRNGDTITLSNPSTNGNFMKSFNIYNGATLLKNQTSTSLSLKSLDPGDYELSVQVIGDNFNPSSNSTTVLASVYTIDYELTNLSKNTSEIKISDGVTLSFKITAINGWWLPEFIDIHVNGELTQDYTYDSYEGTIKIVAKGNIRIIASAIEEPKLRTPVINVEEFNLTIEDVTYAQYYDTYINDELVETYEVETDTEQVATPVISISPKLIMTMKNSDYDLVNTYGVKYDIYVNDEFILTEEEGL